jgi:muramoyltetrapeptide carboxypeptidase LdcA involved in peptidoglycan recycling
VGTPYGEVTRFADEHAPEGLIVYVEVADEDAFAVCCRLHGMRLAGFFDRANAVLVGRTAAPNAATLTQRDAVIDALGSLGVPIIGDVECGHVQPYLPLVNGALARVRCGDDERSLTQTLC